MSMVNQILKMLPSSTFDGLSDKLEALITSKLEEVELQAGERPAVLLIEGSTGYMVNVIRLAEDLNMTIVSQMSLKEFIDTTLKFVKDGNIG